MSCQQDAIEKALAGAKGVESKRKLLEPLFKSPGWMDNDNAASLNIQTHPQVFLHVSITDENTYKTVTIPGDTTCFLKTVEEVLLHEQAVRKAFGLS